MHPSALRLEEVISTVQTYFDREFRGRKFRCKAEVLQIKQHKTRVYIDLVEYDTHGAIIAKIRAIIREKELIDVYLQAHGLLELHELIGQVILFEATCTFHPQRGLSLSVQSLSHEFARGQLHATQEAIRKQLREKQLFDANKQRDFGLPPIRLAVISSATSEGLRDFTTIITDQKRAVSIDLFQAAIHGEQAKTAVKEQLQRIGSSKHTYTAVIITRGGGGGEGLARQNDAGIAEAICRLPYPVILATGHTSDRSILDEIVWQVAKTPSDAAHLIDELLTDIDTDIEDTYTYIASFAHRFLEQSSEHTRELFQQSMFFATHRLEREADRITTLHDALDEKARQKIAYLSDRVDTRFSSISLMDPHTQTDRGYALVFDDSGTYLTKKAIKNVLPGDRLKIVLYGETIEVKVVKE